jgi:hypothetical protein
VADEEEVAAVAEIPDQMIGFKLELICCRSAREHRRCVADIDRQLFRGPDAQLYGLRRL